MHNKIAINLYNFPKKVQSILSKSVKAVLNKRSGGLNGSINIILIKDAEIKRLNVKFRKVNRITDVISFLVSSKPFWGDIYISEQRSQKQAEQQGHAWDRELSYLVIHGVLHLFGYTDYTPATRKKMFKVQDKIFKTV